MNRLISRLRLRGGESRETGGNGVRHIRATAWAGRNRSRYVLTAAEAAPCTCPDFCERDHGNE